MLSRPSSGLHGTLRAAAAALTSYSLALCLAAPPGAADALDADASPSIDLPRTFEQVWYRSGKKKEGGRGKLVGDLTVTSDALELATRRETISIPLESIHVLSYGKLPGDPDTDWCVLGMKLGSGSTRVGFRDGRRLGYGQRTQEIFDTIRAALREASAAQYDLPPGLKPYEQLNNQLTVGLPNDWSFFHHTIVEAEDGLIWGTLLMSPEKLAEKSGDKEALRRVLSGASAAVLIDRRGSAAGMRCDGFSAKAREVLVSWISEEPLLGKGYSIAGAPQVEPTTVDICEGLRAKVRATHADGHEVVLDVRAAVVGNTAVLLGLRCPASACEEQGQEFEKMLTSLRLAVAR